MLLPVCDNGLVAACLGRAAERARALLCCVTRGIGILGNSSNCGAALRQPDLLKSPRRSMLPRCQNTVEASPKTAPITTAGPFDPLSLKR